MSVPYRSPFNRAGVSVLDFADGVQINNGVAYADVAFATALSAISSVRGSSRGRTLYVPAGTYRMAKPLRIGVSIVLQGEGSSRGNEASTRLLFDAGQHGIIVESTQSTMTGNGGGSWIRDIYVAAAGKTAGTKKHGISLRRDAHLMNVWVGIEDGATNSGFSGNGINIVSGDGNNFDGNAWWGADRVYTIGDWVRSPGVAHAIVNLASVQTLALAVTAGIDGTITITRSAAWLSNPVVNETLLIPSGSILAGGSNQNVGFYLVTAATSTTVTATKISDSPFLITGAFTQPVAVGAATHDLTSVTCYTEQLARFVCVQAGTSGSTPPSGTSDSIQDGGGSGGVLWKSPVFSGYAANSMGNCNDFSLHQCTAGDNWGSGLFIEGDDVNAGRTYGFSSSGNEHWGIWDKSFLGNAHYGAHTAANTLGPYRTASHANNYSKFDACYSESGQGTGSLGYFPAIFDGGIHGAGFHAESTAFVQTGSLTTPMAHSQILSGKKIVATTPRVSVGAGLFAGFGFERLNSDNSSTEGSGGQALLMGQWQAQNGTTPEAWVARLSNYGQSGIQFTTADHAGRVEIRSLSVTAGSGSGGVGQFPGSLIGAAYGSPQGALDGAFRPGDLILDQHRSAEQAALYVANVKCGFGSGWAASTVYYEGTTVVPVSVPGTVFRRHSSSTAYTSAGSEPNWASAPAITNTVTNGDGIVWENWGPTQTGFDAIYSFGAGADDKTTVGAITQNTRKGLANIQPGAAARVVTNSLVTATSIIGVSLQFVDATLTQILTCVPAAGSFTVTGNANATAVTKFAWWIIE